MKQTVEKASIVRGGRSERARRFKERRQQRRVYEEAESRGILQVYKA